MGFWSWKVKAGSDELATQDNRSSTISSARSRGTSRVQSVRSSVLSSISSTSPKVPPWEVVFDQHLKQCLRAAENRDFTYFRLSAILNSKPEVVKIDHKATLLEIIPSGTPAHQLEGLNKSRCESVARAFREYVKEIEGAKDEKLEWLAWGRLLDSEEERMLQGITAKIKETSEEAKNIIRQLPLDAMDPAAGLWVEGSGSAMMAFRALYSQTTIVSGRVGDFERGEFGILREAEEKVVDASEAAQLAISGQPRDMIECVDV